MNWSTIGEPRSLERAVVDATDMQAFGARRGGAPTNLGEIEATGPLGDVVLEIEPLDLGGILISRDEHLPVELHAVDGSYWRLRKVSREWVDAYVLEKRVDAAANWVYVDDVDESLGIGTATKLFSEYLDIEVIATPIGAKFGERIHSVKMNTSEAEFSGITDEAVERFGMEDRTLDFD